MLLLLLTSGQSRRRWGWWGGSSCKCEFSLHNVFKSGRRHCDSGLAGVSGGRARLDNGRAPRPAGHTAGRRAWLWLVVPSRIAPCQFSMTRPVLRVGFAGAPGKSAHGSRQHTATEMRQAPSSLALSLSSDERLSSPSGPSRLTWPTAANASCSHRPPPRAGPCLSAVASGEPPRGARAPAERRCDLDGSCASAVRSTLTRASARDWARSTRSPWRGGRRRGVNERRGPCCY